MKHVVILVPEGDFNLASLQGPYDIFSKANRYLTGIGKAPAFRIQLAGLSKGVELEGGMFSVHFTLHIRDITKTDLVIIPALSPDFSVSLERNKDFLPWLIEQYMSGAELASLCSGAFLLAATGLLKGRKCSTHWLVADIFRQMFPDVELVPEKIITDEYGIYSSGGAYSFLNFMLYLVEKFCGHEIAIYCSKVFEIDMDRSCQSPFAVFHGQKDHEDEEIRQAQAYIENNVSSKITIDELAMKFAVSRRNFDRRFKKATDNTPAEYLQRVKIEAAKKGLESGRENVNDVMYSVGYSDRKAFRMMFKKITGLSPQEYRNKYYVPNHLARPENRQRVQRLINKGPS